MRACRVLLPPHATPLAQWVLEAEPLPEPRPIVVPSAWEDYGIPRTYEGPCDYHCTLELSPQPDRRYWLHFGAVSYEATGTLNGMPLGTHQGIWDSFCWELTPHLRKGTNELRVRVYKNGGARYPVPQVLSGFLPYVASTFGGLWQPVHLFETGSAWLTELWVRGDADGRVRVQGVLEGIAPAEVAIAIYAPDSVCVHTARFEVSQSWEYACVLPSPLYRWHPRTPHCYRLMAMVYVDGEASHTVATTFGLRTVLVDGSVVLLNEEPFYPRGVLHWGWYLETHAPYPPLEVARQELATAQRAGFNLLKACLWVPPREYLSLCDELGMTVWLELPLWLPDMNAAQVAQVKREYEAILKQVRNHPSILLWTLGCELSTRFPYEALGELYALVKQLTGSPLVRDNSGGGECYGGFLQEHADFADYHLYGDAHFAHTTFRAFLEMARPPAPWLQGEFADHDTMRDFATLRQTVPPEHLWWLERDPAVNPRGVRWFYETPFVEQRLQQAGLSDALPELVRTSRLEMRAYHKLVLETMRRLLGTSGYVVSGLKDTPITTAGLVDERGMPKVVPETYLAFNADTVLLLDWHRRRVWLAGGDRPANPDPYNHFGGRVVYPRVLASHFGAPLPVETLRWRLQTGDTTLCAGEVALQGESARLTGRGVQFLAQLAVPLPNSDTPLRVCFQAELIAPSGEQVASNEWWWGVYPVPDWASLQGVAVHDPTDALWGLPPLQAVPLAEAHALLTTQWSDQVRAFVEASGNALWLLTVPVPELECARLPFWREAAHRFLPHPLWEAIPRPDYLDECLFAFSTDLACAATTFESAPIQPVWQRVDTRTGYAHWYLGEFTLGKGKVLACTLHFAGHHGDTPLTLDYHPAGQYWLWAMLRYLASR